MNLQPQSRPRLVSIDALRGAIMIIMALDHVRDFFHRSALLFPPTDLARTNTVLFFTRWITHFCLPVFMFTAGMGAFLWWHRGNRTKKQLSRFLWTRGVWFIFLELTVMQFAYNFNVSPRDTVLLVMLWIFGVCMIMMAALIHAPLRWLTVFSVTVIALHNCVDPVNASRFGSAAWVWNIVHQPGVFLFAGRQVLQIYTLLPWIAVMTGGFCFGSLFTLEAAARQKIMLRIGLFATVAFFVVRSINRYGDPAPWSVQKSAIFTVLSFLNCTKYPASLDFLLMTLGPAILVLIYLDRHPLKATNPVVIYGRVPFFYFVLHFYLIHCLMALMAWIRYGHAAFSFIFNPIPSMGGPRQLFPANFGYSLWVVYVMWALVVVLLYPVCRWFAGVKSRRKDWWLSYL
ncbi:DUF1624 domain-containing protein [Alloacidobacterium sp.]|uniref:DUF1624 domain-containing protein n=1 Tax=Alloacidobacterium sp. TaxID=2951999 RepID=UPI002D38255E|nr:heparan-alpha-glucosaminide N-acetyltransferase domain-containing protein [Alloacidobacterium sp.]HYK34406.1 heparan-alpha-glucosaminide N-acetyltransferase domain-containing protein [Alloacidobacterium sp.]